MHCRIFIRILGDYALDVNSTLPTVVTTKNHVRILPNVPWEVKSLSVPDGEPLVWRRKCTLTGEHR